MTLSCSKCGAQAAPSDKFCGACGTPIPSQAGPADAGAAKQPRPAKRKAAGAASARASAPTNKRNSASGQRADGPASGEGYGGARQRRQSAQRVSGASSTQANLESASPPQGHSFSQGPGVDATATDWRSFWLLASGAAGGLLVSHLLFNVLFSVMGIGVIGPFLYTIVSYLWHLAGVLGGMLLVHWLGANLDPPGAGNDGVKPRRSESDPGANQAGARPVANHTSSSVPRADVQGQSRADLTDEFAMPAHAAKWSWSGASCAFGWPLGGFWAYFHKSPIAFLSLIPVVHLVMVVVMGLKGGAWSWHNRDWQSVQEYVASHRVWTYWGLAFSALIVLGRATT